MAVTRYTYKQVDDWFAAELRQFEERAESYAVALAVVSPYPSGLLCGVLQKRWERLETIIDAVGLLRQRFREFDQKRTVDASHDLKGGNHE